MQLGRVLSVAGTAAVTVALILQVVACATLAWLNMTANTGVFSFGLWEICNNEIRKCMTYEELEGLGLEVSFKTELTICKVFCILGVLFLAATIALAVVQIVLTFLEHDLPRVITGTPLATAVLALITILVCVIVWAVKVYLYFVDGKSRVKGEMEVHLGYSFFLSVAAGVVGLLGAALFVVGINKRAD